MDVAVVTGFCMIHFSRRHGETGSLSRLSVTSCLLVRNDGLETVIGVIPFLERNGVVD